MERAITGFYPDEKGDWVAELTCGHNQHVRHRPPFQLRPWVVERDGRMASIGTPLGCPLCDRAELPEGLRRVRPSPEWDEYTIPAGLLRSHRVASGLWGVIVVRDGLLRFTASTEPTLHVVVGSGAFQAIPPEVDHSVEPFGSVRFSIDFMAIDRDEPSGRVAVVDSQELSDRRTVDEGGDPACWAQLLCPECGAVLEGGIHPQVSTHPEVLPPASPPESGPKSPNRRP